ncbi:MAG: TolB family protein, partial [Candidatus Methylomirabilales bacterium]
MTKRAATFALIAAVLLVLAGREAVSQSEGLTLEQILSAPFPASLVAAPAGGKIAWVFNDQGVRNVWVAEPPHFRGRAVTSYQEDDGQDLGSLAWTPDAEAIVYVRGGNPNRQGKYPNPTSDPRGIEQAVWVASLTGGEPRKLGEGASPAVSPRGDRVAFVKKDQIWWAPLEKGGEAEQIHVRGRPISLRWSRDGSQLAFVSRRDGHSFIGVWDSAGHTVRYLDASVDRDSHPAWSPDGKRIAFIRVPASRYLFTFGPHRSAEPWSLRAADVASGEGREIWKASEGRGSVFRNVLAKDPLLWGAD